MKKEKTPFVGKLRSVLKILVVAVTIFKVVIPVLEGTMDDFDNEKALPND